MNTAGKISLPSVLRFHENYKNETDYIVWNEITIRLNEIISVCWEQESSIVAKLNSFILSIYSNQISKFSFQITPGESEKEALLRPLILGMAGKCGH